MGGQATFLATYSIIVALRPRLLTPPSQPVCERLRELELWAPCRLRGSYRTGLRVVRRRGERAGRRIQQQRKLGQLCLPSTSTSSPADVSTARSITFGVLNIRSLLRKFDDVTELCRDRHIDLLCLTESWCDSDSAVLGRLRNAGYNVVDRPRPRHAGVDELSVNHGGIVVVAAANISLSPIIDVDRPTTFEMLCTRAVIGRFSATMVVIYRPGSTTVSQKFFDELAVVLDRVAIYQEPIFVVGDLNIRLDRSDDRDADQLRLLVDCYGLVLHDTAPTHQLGGKLDVVISHDVIGRPASVTVEDVGLSDHFLLCWEASATRATPHSMTVNSRQWSRLDMEHFRSAISSSRLCQPGTWSTDIDEMAALYDDELNSLLDQLLPKRQFIHRSRPSDPYFDKECHDAKRLC
jgi:hypothetical protein